ncbi:MAG: SpoVA/SpoVAEb family sporulation membrane protein [Oscillospiraceae bacterium]|nr:SpoVA/SpoVAEb family sporulation membrane protein [Oscillospiraceae bacterium]
MIYSCLKAFLAGGLLCLLGQILIDRTALTPARILTSYVVAGVVLEATGLYAPFRNWAGAGASVPLTGFGSNLAQGAREAVLADGLLGVLTGGLKAASAGLTAAILFGLLAALLSRPDPKE